MNQADRDMLIQVHTDIRWIKKALSGNGDKGLIGRVRNLETWKYVVSGGLLVLTSLIGWGVVIIR